MERMSLSLIVGLIGLGFLSPLARPASVDRDLQGIKKKIENEKRGISQVQKKEGSMLELLGKIQNELERKTQELKEASARLGSITSEMRRREAEAEDLKLSLVQRKELFKKRALALYRWSRSGTPLVIFNGGLSWGAVSRHKRYLERTVSFDRDLVRQLTEEAEQREALQEGLTQTKAELDSRRDALAQAKESVRREAERKKELLASLRREKESRVRAIKELEQAALRLQKMMEEISRRSVRKVPETPPGVGLGALRGSLEWPVKGQLISGFGKVRHREVSAEIFHNGIDIEAALGEDIRAVEKGTVVFADRFSGYGKMVIVDHGERYYTIYAHLSEILKKNGDAVRRRESLGLLGDSDSLGGAKLYFEMRKDGRSIDPVPFFRRQ
jgi:septal ring factor EnvC (AmiA/AmiB activator)